ncbi:hypothetical protein [Streptomyces albus]|uniref:hypothetical protein n=1 Tax=Streptomyces albus TaxID=1888 RepID=UPI00345522D1
MISFHEPPEWQQFADRHTELRDPVLTVRQLPRFGALGRKTPLRIDNAHVCVTPKNGYETFLPPQRPNLTARRYTAVYEVDMGVHPVLAQLRFPSDNDAFEFEAGIELSWQVTDPARFVASGHRDVPQLLLSEVQERARPVTRMFAIHDSAQAEQALLKQLTAAEPLGSSVGLRVVWTVRVRRDEDNIAHQRRLQAIDHATTEAVREAQQGMAVDAAQDMRARQQDRFQVERAMAYGEQQQELAMRQLEWQHQQQLLTGRQQLELQEIETEKIRYYAHHLSQGGATAWAAHLARHPEDSRLVMENLRQDQRDYLRSQTDVVTEVLGNGHTEAYQLEGLQQTALQVVKSFLTEQHMHGGPGPSPHPSAGGTEHPGLTRSASSAPDSTGEAQGPSAGPDRRHDAPAGNSMDTAPEYPPKPPAEQPAETVPTVTAVRPPSAPPPGAPYAPPLGMPGAPAPGWVPPRPAAPPPTAFTPPPRTGEGAPATGAVPGDSPDPADRRAPGHGAAPNSGSAPAADGSPLPTSADESGGTAPRTQLAKNTPGGGTHGSGDGSPPVPEDR